MYDWLQEQYGSDAMNDAEMIRMALNDARKFHRFLDRAGNSYSE